MVRNEHQGNARGDWLLALLACSAVCHSTEACCTQSAEAGCFDTDSKPVGINNRCSAWISHDVTDFIGEIRPSNHGSRDLVGHAPPTSRPGPCNGSSKMTAGRCMLSESPTPAMWSKAESVS
jgi:hypothetical protein